MPSSNDTLSSSTGLRWAAAGRPWRQAAGRPMRPSRCSSLIARPVAKRSPNTITRAHPVRCSWACSRSAMRAARAASTRRSARRRLLALAPTPRSTIDDVARSAAGWVGISSRAAPPPRVPHRAAPHLCCRAAQTSLCPAQLGGSGDRSNASGPIVVKVSSQRSCSTARQRAWSAVSASPGPAGRAGRFRPLRHRALVVIGSGASGALTQTVERARAPW